ncbi:hypothetical protein WN944_026889 [Citrus x changshan-huyou]|uniref:Ubiquitin-like protease family profile domain-containing protein n=1 Tax=Citrus x changshan-huyou TaxID=2935761 RepID=A0AAP0LHG3_9ROSI
MGVRDGGTHVDLNDQAVDITNLRVVYSSGPRGIHIAELFYFSSVVYDRPSIDRTVCPISVWNNDEIRRFLKYQKKLGGIKSNKVSMRDPDRLHKPQQAEPPGWNNANNDAFQLLMERFGSFVAQNKESFQTIERRLENIEKILGELTSKYHGGSSKQPVAPDPPSNLKSQNRTSLDGKTMSKTEGKMILVSDDDTVDRRVKASLRAFDAMLGCIGTTAHTSETPLDSFQFDRGHDLDLTPIPREEGENLAEPLDTKKEFQTSTSMSVPTTRPARNRRSGRYQLSPYDKVSRGAKAKFKAGPFYVNNPLSLDQLKLIQYAFDKGGNGSEIIISTDDQFISMHNFMSLLPNTALSEEQSALTVGADVDGFAQAASVGKPFMLDFQRCQKIYVPINDGAFHWFLFIVNVKEGYGEVWDPLPDGRSNRKREQQAERILHSLDSIFHSKLPPNVKPSTRFIWFPIRSGEGVPKQPNGFDCGIYVIKFMETPGLIPNKSYMHDSQDVRGRLAVQLIDSAFNEARVGLLAQANVTFAEHAAQARAIPSTQKANTYKIGAKALERIWLAGSLQPVSQLRSRTLWKQSGLLVSANRFAGFVPELSRTNPMLT